MAKDLTLKTPDGSTILYPKTVTDLVFDNASGESVKSILSGITGATAVSFDFTSGSTAAWANRNNPYNFVAGKSYKIEVLTADNSVRTYFSTRNSSSPGSSVQNNLCSGKGPRSEVFTCTGNADSIFMSLGEAMTTGIVYNVRVYDLSEGMQVIDSLCDDVDDIKENIVTNTHILHNSLKDNVIQKPFTFSKTGYYIKTDGTIDTSSNWYQSNVVYLSKGKAICFKAKPTGNGGVLLALTDSQQSYYTPVVTGTTTIDEYNYTMEADGYVILQYYQISGDVVVYDDSDRLISIEETISENRSLVWVGKIVGSGNSYKRNYVYGLVPGRVYALSLKESLITNSMIYYYDSSGTETQLHNQTIGYPLFFKVPSDSAYIGFVINAPSGNIVNYTFEDVTEALEAAGAAKVLMFETGNRQANGSYQYNNTMIRTKRDYSLFLNKGDVVKLTSYTGVKLVVTCIYSESGSYDSGWVARDVTIPYDGEYFIKVVTDPEVAQTSPDALAALVRLEKAGSSDSEAISKISKAIDVELHNDARSFTFTNTGYYIKTDGSVGTSSYWYQSNVVKMYKNETFKIYCATTGYGVIVALTDTNKSFYTPVVTTTDNQVQAQHSYTAKEDCYIIVQYWRKTGDPELYSDSGRLLDIESRVTALEGNALPDYAKDEQDRVYRHINNQSNADNIVVMFNTDQHFAAPYDSYEPMDGSGYNPKYVMRGLRSMVELAERLPVDAIVLGGDVASYEGVVSNTVNGIINEINVLNEPFANVKVPFVSIPGNHDAFQNNANITAQAMYQADFKRSRYIKGIVHSGTDNCDCYFDDADKKIRFIFVDTYSQNGRTESYSTFLSNALSGMDNDYKAIIFSHNPLTNEFAGVVKSISSSGTEVDAFQNPSDLHATINAYASKIIACICGHSHVDAHGVSSSNILYIETTTAAPHTIGHFENIPYQKTMGTVTETAFDIFVINTEAQTIEAVRYGQGTNRKWKYKGTGIGLISYKNCVSVKCSVPSLSLVFTNTANNSDVVTVDCGSDGFGEAYLTLGATYNITCSGHTLSTSSVAVDGNKSLAITVS